MIGALGYSWKSRRIPWPVALWSAAVKEWYSGNLSRNEPAYTRYTLSLLGRSFTMNIDSARDELGYNPKKTSDDALQEFVKHFKISHYGNP
jgi:nucleoside-diphosphate-sugar epimerase